MKTSSRSHPGNQLHQRPVALVIGFLLIALTRTVLADAAAVERGGNVFDEECAECHSLREGKNKKGPTLFNVVGRSAGTEPGYLYSAALKKGGFSWTTDKLDEYVKRPKAVIPDGKMKYSGLADASARSDLIEFLAEQK